jgi:hypothetical protein
MNGGKMTARDKNRIAVLGTILGAAELMVGSDPSATVQSKIDVIQRRAQDLLDNLPDATAKETRSIKRRIIAFGAEITKNGINGMILLCFLIALIEAIIEETTVAGIKKKFEALHRSMCSLQTYYDRELKYSEYYKKADELATWWAKAA